MNFLITVNMPGKKAREDGGQPVHQIFCTHPAKSLTEFMALLSDDGYAIVEEFYKDARDPSAPAESRGKIAISYQVVGKVKEFSDAKPARYGGN